MKVFLLKGHETYLYLLVECSALQIAHSKFLYYI